jgi:hypothetical protein
MRVYHGTSQAHAEDIIKNGVDQDKSDKGYFGTGFYCAHDESLARSNYADFSDDTGTVLAIDLSPDTRILDLRQSEGFDKWRTLGLERQLHLDRFDRIATRAGIDALIDDSFGGIVIYNTAKISNIEVLDVAPTPDDYDMAP